MVETPVLFITFARPDYARQTWEGIKAAKPKTLYFYSNKGRDKKEGEVERNNEIRAYVNEIDWKCDLHTWFREETANVYDSLRGAIDWLFDNEERGIVLEEDCVPTKAFFSFVDQLIVKFENEKNVWCISGDNFIDDNLIPNDYYFSQYHYMYGWATWADRWHKIDWYSSWNKKDFVASHFKELYKTKRQINYRVKELKRLSDFINTTNCWDYKFGYTIDCYKGLTVHPKYHLVTNVGIMGAHHKNKKEGPINKKATFTQDKYQIIKPLPQLKANLDIDLKIFMLLQFVPFFKRVKDSLRYRIPLFANKAIKMFYGKEFL